jgi:hypothetical protein
MDRHRREGVAGVESVETGVFRVPITVVQLGFESNSDE